MSKCQTMEVYVCKKDGEIVYIGKGRKGRHKHCNSGVSHVFELNEIYFKEGSSVLETEVVRYFKTDEEALAYEKELIVKHKPKLNKTYTGNDVRGKVSKEARDLRNKLKDYITKSNTRHDRHNYKVYYDLVDEFISHFGYNFSQEGSLRIYGKEFYRKLGLKRITQLSRYLRNDGSYAENCYLKIFTDCIKDNFKLDLRSYLT